MLTNAEIDELQRLVLQSFQWAQGYVNAIAIMCNQAKLANDAPPALPDEPEIIGTMRKNLDGWDNRVVCAYIDALRAHRGK